MGERLTLQESITLAEGKKKDKREGKVRVLQVSTLAALLLRFRNVVTISSASDTILSPLPSLMSLGLCKNLRKLVISRGYNVIPAGVLACLGAKIGSGALLALEELHIQGFCGEGGIQSLLRGFCKDASPLLHTVEVFFSSSEEEYFCESDGDVEKANRAYEEACEEAEWQTGKNIMAFAAMLEARKALGYSRG